MDWTRTISDRIAWLDALSPPERDPTKNKEETSPLQAHLAKRHPLFKLTHDIRLEGWRAKDLDKVYEKKLAQNNVVSSDRDELNSRNIAFDVFNDIMALTGCIPKGACRFLDLGAAPGGFSMAILKDNLEAKGTGITLPFDQGGYKLLLPQEVQNRYDPHFEDLLKLDVFPTASTEDKAFLPSKGLPDWEPFDAVIVAARLHNEVNVTTRSEPFDVLHIIQLVIALQQVKQGGNIIVRQKTPDVPCSIRLFCDFEPFSKKMQFAKSERGWQTSSFCYFVAFGIDKTCPAYQKILDGYLAGLRDFYTGRTKDVEPTVLDDQDLVKSGAADRCVLCNADQVWQVHSKALSARLRRQSGRGRAPNSSGRGNNNWTRSGFNSQPSGRSSNDMWR